MHSTNYINTFIQVADDCPVLTAVAPPLKGGAKTIACLQFEMVTQHPYQYTSDDVLFQVHAIKNNISPTDRDAARQTFFSKGQACLRCSPLVRRYGWGLHHNADGKVAAYAVDSDEYITLMADKHLKQVKAMRTKKKPG